ncbi:hypothetical protein [Shewanella canadensis]|uniref:hypothetical protein n=1 Tax=Shewanella canadensis TaxID=271096 RepID=UPI00163B1CE2|nr:hypothetical protein [Shewanella canadensis]
MKSKRILFFLEYGLAGHQFKLQTKWWVCSVEDACCTYVAFRPESKKAELFRILPF